MFKDLIEYEDLLEACDETFGFSGVTLKRDFGPWKSGDKAETLWFMLDSATVEEQSDAAELVKSCKFQLTAVS